MATAGGPDIITDGLVFGYDADDRSPRFYSGEPTINYLATGVAGYNPFTAAHWLGATLTEVGTSELNTPILRYVTTGTNYTYSHDRMLDDDFAALSSQQVAFSLYIRRVEGASNCRIRTYDNVTSYTSSSHAVTTDFTRIQMTKTLGANPTRIFVMVDNSGGGTYEFHSPQLNIGPHATQFTKLPRTGTQSLIDLKKTTTIDVSNVSFDSTAHPIFDGTDDYINYSSPIDVGNVFSVNFWINPTSKTRQSILSNAYPHQSNKGFWIACPGNNSTGFFISLGNDQKYAMASPNSLTTGVWQMVTVVANGSNDIMRLYVNGIETTYSHPDNADVQIEYDSGVCVTGSRNYVGDWLASKVPLLSVYDRALTQTEVKQNFNSYKNRFNL